MTGVCVVCGAAFVTTFTLPTNECDACFNARYDAEPPDGEDYRLTLRDEEAALDAFTDRMAHHYQIESVAL